MTRDLKDLERQVEELQVLASSTANRGHLDSLKSKQSAIANLLGVAAQGALVRSRFMNITQMDAPSRFFFGLEQKNGQKKTIHSLRTSSGSEVSDPSEIRKYAAGFYRDLFKSEWSHSADVHSSFLGGLPQVSEEENSQLAAGLTLGELTTAIGSLQGGRAPGLDGLPADFYKSFWSIIGEDLLEVVNESLREGRLPLSCRRAVITLLPKKGDLQELRNWRPVSLLCTDYKILSKALALRLREVMASIIHPDQTYCVPNRLISDNVTLIRDYLDLSSSLDIETGLISIDQEKAFDRVEHQYLWQTLAAFGFDPGFIAMIRVLYTDVASILKINGGLSAPFGVQRGVRQGCSLSGMLYSLAIEPLLHKLRTVLKGVRFPQCDVSFKLSVYADDLVVLLNTQEDIDFLTDAVKDFGFISSAKVNWGKSEALMVGGRLGDRLRLPGGLVWKKGGFKYLGVFLGDETSKKKNWENVVEKVKGRLCRWKWLTPKMSYRGRTLILNNLVSSSLWHRLACVDPPASLLTEVQRVLIDFFWDKMHWIPQSVLFLPKEEGGQGLVQLASRTAAFRLQFIQRPLTGPRDVLWRPLAQCILQRFNGLGLVFNLFLMDTSKMDKSSLPGFYRSVFSVWNLLKKQRPEQADSLHWLLQEPVLSGTVLDCPSWGGAALSERLKTAGVCTLRQVVELAGPRLDQPIPLAARLGIKSIRFTGKLLQYWSHKLMGHEWSLLDSFKSGERIPDTQDPFPSIGVFPDLQDCGGPLLEPVQPASLESASGKTFYHLMVKTFNRKKLNGLSDTPWRSHLRLDSGLKPEWRSIYKPPLSKRHADLQWRLLHGIIAVNSFISVINAAVEDKCPFCKKRETVFHAFSECQRLLALFLFLQTVFTSCGKVFNQQVFICGFKYTRQHKHKCQFLNFVLGQAKMAVYISRKKKVEENMDIEAKLLCINMMKARLLIDFSFYKASGDLESFQQIWCFNRSVSSVTEDKLLFGELMFM